MTCTTSTKQNLHESGKPKSLHRVQTLESNTLRYAPQSHPTASGCQVYSIIYTLMKKIIEIGHLNIHIGLCFLHTFHWHKIRTFKEELIHHSPEMRGGSNSRSEVTAAVLPMESQMDNTGRSPRADINIPINQ